jgi:hypothetical protein
LTTIGVLLVEETRGILSGIVRDVLDADPGVDLLGELADIRHTEEEVERTGSAAVVWIVADARRSMAPAELLRRHPALRVLAVEDGGREGFLWRMRPSRTPVGELSPRKLICALRDEP